MKTHKKAKKTASNPDRNPTKSKPPVREPDQRDPIILDEFRKRTLNKDQGPPAEPQHEFNATDKENSDSESPFLEPMTQSQVGEPVNRPKRSSAV